MFTDRVDLARRLLYVNHWAWVKIRLKALESGDRELAALADDMEVLPMWWDENRPAADELIKSTLIKTGLKDAFDSPFPR